MKKMTDAYEIARYIKEVKKKTPVKVYMNADFDAYALKEKYSELKVFGNDGSFILVGDYEDVQVILSENEASISDYHMEHDRRNSAIPMFNKLSSSARIEPGAIIRDMVSIADKVVVMMGAVINIGSEIDEGSMIDMNAVLGARTIIGKNVHVGAGTVVAGVLEPPSATPVIVEDDVMIGANAVILEGVKVGKGAVVAAGAVVTKDVPEGSVVAGSPAKVIKMKDDKTSEKTQLMDDLRG